MTNGLKTGDWLVLLVISNMATFAIVSLSWSIIPISITQWIVTQSGAAWTQALFTLVGLAIAIAIPTVQYRQDARNRESRRMRDAAESLMYLYMLCEHVHDCVHFLKKKASSRHAGGPEWRQNSNEPAGLFERLKAAELRAIDGKSRIALFKMNRLLLNALELYTGPDGVVLPVAADNDIGRQIMLEISKTTQQLQRRSELAYSILGLNPWEHGGVFLIRRVGVGDSGHIERVEWQLYDKEREEWIGAPAVVPVTTVYQHLRYSVGSVGTSFDGRTADGPMIKVANGENDSWLVETVVRESDKRTLFDLPRI